MLKPEFIFFVQKFRSNVRILTSFAVILKFILRIFVIANVILAH